ncbi:hypothetical protein V7S43_001848 [Phytophthora oleae]|uniref:Uncharacterized protein n=1 Tax=Phytophthora oleae TaxID=2107226 RepID=A0ABD3G3N9_9STRA
MSVFVLKAGLYSEMQAFKKIGGITPFESGQAQAERVLKTVKQLNDRSATHEIDTCIFSLGDVVLRSGNN